MTYTREIALPWVADRTELPRAIVARVLDTLGLYYAVSELEPACLPLDERLSRLRREYADLLPREHGVVEFSAYATFVSRITSIAPDVVADILCANTECLAAHDAADPRAVQKDLYLAEDWLEAMQNHGQKSQGN